MSRLSTSFVLGYHGCDKKTGRKALTGRLSLQYSDKAYDWLGPGVYFWESDPGRALEWAKWKTSRGDYFEPFVIGAVIDLGNCLDLLVQEDLELVRSAYDSLVAVNAKSGRAMPRNKDASGDPNEDKTLRFLDCAVIRHLHSSLEEQSLASSEDDTPIPSFDTVRGLFVESDEVYPGGGFYRKTHTQIAVRNDTCIKGIFIPR